MNISTTTTTPSIHLKTAIPGPIGSAIIARREAATPAALGRVNALVVDHAHGALITDVDGNTFIDFAGGIGALAAGHTPTTVVHAIKQAADKLLHVSSLVGTLESYVELCETLNQLAPGQFAKKTVLSNTGAEAVENAIRAAREATGRPAIICFEGAYHGRSLLTATLTSKYDTYKKNFGPFATDVYKLPFPYVYRRPDFLSEDQFVEYMIQQFDHALTAQVDPSAVAAVILEPVQGEGGFIVTPPRFMTHIAQRCKEHGIVFIVDEVQTGWGRTGKLFAAELYGIEPDILITAKSMASGMPLSAITGRAAILDAVHAGGFGGTYGGNPLACAAAIESINFILANDLAARAEQLGATMRQTFTQWQQTYPFIGDVRGLGAMLALEFVTNPTTKTPAKDLTAAIATEAYQRGVIVLKTGLFSNCIRMLVPLVITDAQLQEGLAVIEAAIATVANSALARA